MSEFSEALQISIGLVLSWDPGLREIVGLSLKVSGSAVLISSLVGLSVGAVLATSRFPGRGAVLIVLNSLLGLPPVVVGLAVYLALSNMGPFASLQLLYTPTAMVIAQIIIVTPIVTALTRQTVEDLYVRYDEQLRAFGVDYVTKVKTLVFEARHILITIILAAFGRAIAEVGAVIIVGGNINHVTRVMTTTIALETSRGEFSIAIALGIVLMCIALIVNVVVAIFKRSDPTLMYS